MEKYRGLQFARDVYKKLPSGRVACEPLYETEAREQSCPIYQKISLYERASWDLALAVRTAKEQDIYQYVKTDEELLKHFMQTALTIRYGCITQALCRANNRKPCRYSEPETTP